MLHFEVELTAANVGTENDTGNGTTINVATNEGGNVTFYEIKTGSSVRTSIRQAIPQLLEYAFWPDTKRAEKLIIVSHLRTTKTAERYLKYLRETYGLPLFYQQFDTKKNTLI